MRNIQKISRNNEYESFFDAGKNKFSNIFLVYHYIEKLSKNPEIGIF
jgi:hypothetical protein